MPKTNLTPQGVAALAALEEALVKSILSTITPAIKQGAVTDHQAFIGVVSVLNAIAIDAGITAGFTKTNYINGVSASWDRVKADNDAEEKGEDNPYAQQVLDEVKMAQQAMDALMARLKGNGEGEGK